MTNSINLPSFAEATKVAYPILEAGVYTLEVSEIRQQTIKSGKYEGQPVLNIGFITMTGGENATPQKVMIWKQLPMFNIDATDVKGLSWLRMSTMAFAAAVGAKGKLNLDKLVGAIVEAEVGVQSRADRPDETQNFIKTFVVAK